MDIEKIRQLGRSQEITFHEGVIQLAPVGNSRDLQRILAVPRRKAEDVDIRKVHSIVAKPGGTMRLRPLQAQALAEALDGLGVFAVLAVGGGKTLLACLLPTVLRKRAIVLAPAGLVRQAEAMCAEYAKHWKIRSDIKFLSYGALSRADRARELADFAPELIIADEAHNLRNRDAARTKRFMRYMSKNPGTQFIPMTGTITKRSLHDMGHLMQLALRDYSALPHFYPTLSEWADALDVGDNRRPAGALSVLMRPGDRDVREGWRRWFVETPGVVASGADELGASLVLVGARPPRSKIVQAALQRLNATWERPDGVPLMTTLEFARTERQVRLGGFYRDRWDPGVSEADRDAWRDARALWNADVRWVLQHRSRDGLDSPLLVRRAVERGELALASWGPWEAVQARVRAPSNEWVWLDSSVVDYAVRWARGRGPAVIWSDVVPVGREIAKRVGAPYYGEGPKAAQGILHEDGSRTIVASINAHGTGRNLQCFDTALVVGGSPTGTVWEQLLGRLHRSGQEADEVRFHCMFMEEVHRARDDARYIYQTTGVQQKLLGASYVR